MKSLRTPGVEMHWPSHHQLLFKFVDVFLVKFCMQLYTLRDLKILCQFSIQAMCVEAFLLSYKLPTLSTKCCRNVTCYSASLLYHALR